jgi:tripartite-type tricarboxylate transporter receptor subunit TctC
VSHPTPPLLSALVASFLTIVLATSACVAGAQDFPTKPVTLVVPYPPGSTTDMVVRLFQPRLGELLGQSVIVENRGGASTNIATEHVARAAPDGYTVLLQAPNIATNEYAFKNLRWKREDFAPVGTLVRWSNVLVAGPSAPVNDIQQLLALGKTTALNYGTPGAGSLSHLAVETLKVGSGLAMEHVTYAGAPPMINSLLGGHIQYAATNPANFMAHVKDPSKKMVPMVVLGTQRDTTIPDVPTLAEFGIHTIESYGWLGVLVPAGTPPAVVNRLNSAFMAILRTPAIADKLKASYLEPFGSSPQEFGRFMAAENRKWGDAFRAAGITPD